jgi:hypothetical protein
MGRIPVPHGMANTMKRLMKRSVLVGLGVFALFLAYLGSRQVSSRVYAQEVGHNPYTVSLVYYNLNPTTHKTSIPFKYMHAVRSDGSFVNADWVKLPNGQQTLHREVLDLQAKVRFFVDDSTETLNVYNVTKHDMMLHGTTGVPPNGVCEAYDHGEVLSSTPEKYMGYDVTHLVEVMKNVEQSGGLRADEYLAPKFDCYPLKRVFYFTKRGSSEVDHLATHEATLIVEGEPDASLFAQPSGYVDRSPTEMFNEAARRFGGPGAAAAPPESLARQEEIYRKNKQIPPAP